MLHTHVHMLIDIHTPMYTCQPHFTATTHLTQSCTDACTQTLIIKCIRENEIHNVYVGLCLCVCVCVCVCAHACVCVCVCEHRAREHFHVRRQCWRCTQTWTGTLTSRLSMSGPFISVMMDMLFITGRLKDFSFCLPCSS